jgi:hypothetical protein
VHAVCTFLCLASYYHWFIRVYGTIATPLTTLLRKDGFHRSAEVEDAFRALHCPLTTALVPQLPNFGCDFIVECDASGSGFGTILH